MKIKFENTKIVRIELEVDVRPIFALVEATERLTDIVRIHLFPIGKTLLRIHRHSHICSHQFHLCRTRRHRDCFRIRLCLSRS